MEDARIRRKFRSSKIEMTKYFQVVSSYHFRNLLKFKPKNKYVKNLCLPIQTARLCRSFCRSVPCPWWPYFESPPIIACGRRWRRASPVSVPTARAIRNWTACW